MLLICMALGCKTLFPRGRRPSERAPLPHGIPANVLVAGTNPVGEKRVMYITLKDDGYHCFCDLSECIMTVLWNGGCQSIG